MIAFWTDLFGSVPNDNRPFRSAILFGLRFSLMATGAAHVVAALL